MEIVSFRVPKKLKEKMKEVDVNWSEEVRGFIERKVKEYMRKKALDEIETMLSGLPPAKKGTAESYVREDRDSN